MSGVQGNTPLQIAQMCTRANSKNMIFVYKDEIFVVEQMQQTSFLNLFGVEFGKTNIFLFV